MMNRKQPSGTLLMMLAVILAACNNGSLVTDVSSHMFELENQLDPNKGKPTELCINYIAGLGDSGFTSRDLAVVDCHSMPSSDL